MHPRQKAIKEFLTELNDVLGVLYDRTGEYPMSDVPGWYSNLRVIPGRPTQRTDMKQYSHIYSYINVAKDYSYNRISCAKYVYIKNISLRNFVIGLFSFDNKIVSSSIVNLPEHADLKEFFVPEELIIHFSPLEIFEIN